MQRRNELLATFLAVVIAGSGCAASQTDDAASVKLPSFVNLRSALFQSGPELLAAMNHAESEVALCMQRTGWQYAPADQSVYFSPAPVITLDTAVKFADEFGYEQAASYVGQDQRPPPDPMSDVNQVYSQGLGDQYNAYWAAAEACKAEVIEPYYAARRGLQAKYQMEVSEAVSTDPDLEKAAEAWRDCMGQLGYQFAVRSEAEILAVDSFEAWVQGVFPDGEVPSYSSLTAAQRGEVDRLAEAERSLAHDDAECWVQTIGKAESSAIQPLEESFLLRHGDEIRRLAEYWVAP